jgi:hypothetical protein
VSTVDLPPTEDAERWNLLLDAYEHTLDAHRAHLAATASAVTGSLPAAPAPFVAPGELGSLPEELEARAHALVEATRQLSGVARTLLAQLPPQPPVHRAATSSSPSTFDRGL